MNPSFKVERSLHEGAHKKKKGLPYHEQVIIDLNGNVNCVEVDVHNVNWIAFYSVQGNREAEYLEYDAAGAPVGDPLDWPHSLDVPADFIPRNHFLIPARYMTENARRKLTSEIDARRNPHRPWDHRSWGEKHFWEYLSPEMAAKVRAEMERRQAVNIANIEKNRRTNRGRDAAIERSAESAAMTAKATAQIGPQIKEAILSVLAELGLGKAAAAPSPAPASEESGNANPMASKPKKGNP